MILHIEFFVLKIFFRDDENPENVAGMRKPYKGYAFGGLFEDECTNYWSKTKKHAQRVKFAEKNVILYPNNEDPGKFCFIKSPQIMHSMPSINILNKNILDQKYPQTKISLNKNIPEQKYP